MNKWRSIELESAVEDVLRIWGSQRGAVPTTLDAALSILEDKYYELMKEAQGSDQTSILKALDDAQGVLLWLMDNVFNKLSLMHNDSDSCPWCKVDAVIGNIAKAKGQTLEEAYTICEPKKQSLDGERRCLEIDAEKHCPVCGWTKILPSNHYSCWTCKAVLETLRIIE